MSVTREEKVYQGVVTPTVKAWLAKYYNALNPRTVGVNSLTADSISSYYVTETTESTSLARSNSEVTGVIHIAVIFGVDKKLRLSRIDYESFTLMERGERMNRVFTPKVSAPSPEEELDAMSAANTYESGWDMNGNPLTGGAEFSEDHTPYSEDAVSFPTMGSSSNTYRPGENKYRPRLPSTAPPIKHSVSSTDGITAFNQTSHVMDTDISKAVGFECSCNENFFCSYVPSYLSSASVLKNDGWLRHLRRDEPTQFLLPVFGHVLHRIEISKVELRDWQQNVMTQLLVSSHVYPGIDDSSYHPFSNKFGKDSGFLGMIIRQIETSFRSNGDAKAIVDGGVTDVMQFSSRSCKAKSHSGFGSQKKMHDWLELGSFDSRPETEPKLWAAVFTSLNYNACWPCARAMDTAFWMTSST